MTEIDQICLCGADILMIVATTCHPAAAQTDAAANFPPQAHQGHRSVSRPVAATIFLPAWWSQAAGNPRPVLDHREQARSRRPAFRLSLSPAACRRLHALCGCKRRDVDRVGGVPEAQLPSDQKLHSAEQIANFPLIMTSQTTIAPKTVSELVVYAKANPGKSNYATTSPPSRSRPSF